MTWRRCAAGCAPWSATASSSSTARAITASRKKWIWCAAAAIEAQHAGQSTVAMQHAAHLLGREEQIVAALVGDEETETVGMTHHAAAHQIHFLREAVIALAIDDELAVALHGAQPAAQRLQVILA